MTACLRPLPFFLHSLFAIYLFPHSTICLFFTKSMEICARFSTTKSAKTTDNKWNILILSLNLQPTYVCVHCTHVCVCFPFAFCLKISANFVLNFSHAWFNTGWYFIMTTIFMLLLFSYCQCMYVLHASDLLVIVVVVVVVVVTVGVLILLLLLLVLANRQTGFQTARARSTFI